jgi:hypothetical protein
VPVIPKAEFDLSAFRANWIEKETERYPCKLAQADYFLDANSL